MKRLVTPMLALASMAMLNLPAHAQTPPGPPPAGMPATPPGMPLPPKDELPLSVATEWAQAAIAACKANGYNVTAIYMNNDYDLKVLMRADGTIGATVDVGRRKAYTVIKTGMSSGDFGTSVGWKPSDRPAPPAPGQPMGLMGLPPGPNADPNTIVLPGGVPVKQGNKLAGALSISGAPGGDKDLACVQAGLNKIADKLK